MMDCEAIHVSHTVARLRRVSSALFHPGPSGWRDLLPAVKRGERGERCARGASFHRVGRGRRATFSTCPLSHPFSSGHAETRPGASRQKWHSHFLRMHFAQRPMHAPFITHVFHPTKKADSHRAFTNGAGAFSIAQTAALNSLAHLPTRGERVGGRRRESSENCRSWQRKKSTCGVVLFGRRRASRSCHLQIMPNPQAHCGCGFF